MSDTAFGGPPDDAPSPTLSVVVVARNEAAAIRDCIESVQAAVASATAVADTDVELILVDSNSTDETVAIAREYSITVLRIPRDDLCSCAAGRHVGFEHASGDYVLAVDGDMVLDTHWLDTALGVLQRHPDVAGVDGWLTDRRGGSGEVDYLRGVALYAASALDEVDGFDPRIQGLGDVDVGLRLRDAGYRLLRLPVLTATHPSSSGVGERVRRWRHGYYHSKGQVLRKSLGDHSMLAKWLYRDRLLFSAAAWLFLGLLFAATLQVAPLLVWAGVSAVAFVAVAAVRGVRWTAMKFTLRLGMFLAGVVVGFFRGPTPSTYPLDVVEVVQHHPLDYA